MTTLRNATIKLAFENPELRDQLMSVLSKQANTNPPLLMGYGLNAAAVRYSNAFMVYHIEPDANKSKFYEAVITYADETGYTVMRRWGVLMPNGMTTRITGDKFDKDPRFSGLSTLGKARQIMMKVYKDRLAHGYTSAFGPDHKTPDGRPLTPGKYPTVQDLKPAPKAAPVPVKSYKVWSDVTLYLQTQTRALADLRTATERGLEPFKRDMAEFCADNRFGFQVRLELSEGRYGASFFISDLAQPHRSPSDVKSLFKAGTGFELYEFGSGAYGADSGDR